MWSYLYLQIYFHASKLLNTAWQLKKLARVFPIFAWVEKQLESYLRWSCTKIFDKSIVMHAVKVSCQEVLKPSIPRIHFTPNLVTFLQQCKMKPFICTVIKRCMSVLYAQLSFNTSDTSVCQYVCVDSYMSWERGQTCWPIKRLDSCA